jgi:hypothetical protein
MTQVVHQIRYCWTPDSLLGTRGMGPVESTVPKDQLPIWDRHLRDHVWAANAEPGFTFVVHDGVGALLRKVTTAADGRPGSIAHVLLSQRMTAQAALGLTSWDGWHAAALGVLPWTALQPAAEHGLSQLRTRARALLTDRLAGLFAQVLGAPGECYTVIGESDPLAVTCALGDLIGGIPTFASDESDDIGPHLPTTVFMREAPFSLVTATRRRLNPAAALPDPIITSFASAVVNAYTTNGLDGIAAIRRHRPPADLGEVHEWAEASQFAPGVIAALPGLPMLAQAVLGQLTQRRSLERIKIAASTAPSADLVRALDARLPVQIMAVLVREAMSRALGAPQDTVLLERLAELGPLASDLVAKNLPSGFDNVAYVTRALLSDGDRGVLLERAAWSIPLRDLIHWVDGHAAEDPGGALAAFSALCGRAHETSMEDLDELVDRNVLVHALRQISESKQQASARLVTLLSAMPNRVFEPDMVMKLAGRIDPVLLHALDTIVADERGRNFIHSQIRRAYYDDHNLPGFTALRLEDGLEHKGGRWWRPKLRRTPTNRKPK